MQEDWAMDSRAGKHGDIQPDPQRGLLREPERDLRRNLKRDSDEDWRGDSRGEQEGDLQVAVNGSGGPSMEDASALSMMWA